MICPKCGSHKLKYKVNRTKVLTSKKQFLRKRSISEPRTNFEVKCDECGYEGEIKL